MRLRRFLSRNWGFLLACLIAAWAGLEVGGKGSGILKWLFSPPLTRDAGFHPVDIAGARPLGPVRLTAAEAAAVNERLALAFGAHVPAFRRTSDMAELYELKADARCDRANLDAAACNRIARIDRFFADVLAAMHPKSEHLFWFDLTVYHRGRFEGQTVRTAVFLGADEKVKLAFDLAHIKTQGEFEAFTVRAADTDGLRDLKTREAGNGTLIVDDPGPLKIPKYNTASILVYGGTDPPANGLVSVIMEGDILVRHRFFAAVLGKPVQGIDANAATSGPAAIAAAFEPREEAMSQIRVVTLREAVIDTMGPAHAAGARFAQVEVHGGRGTFYGLVIDGARYVAIDVIDPEDKKDYEFFWDGPSGLKPIGKVTALAEKDRASRESQPGPYYLVALAEAGTADRLLVFRRGEHGSPVAGMWPLTKEFAALESLIEADPKAQPDTGIDMAFVHREAQGDAWMARCERFLSAYPSFAVKTSGDEWRRGACVKGAQEPPR